MFVTKRNGTTEPRDVRKIQRAVAWMCEGLDVSPSDLETSVHLPLTDGVKTRDIQRTLIVEAASKISPEQQDWSYVAARGLLLMLYKQANDGDVNYPTLQSYLARAVDAGILRSRLADPDTFDLERLNDAIVPVRDMRLDYLGLQTLADRYFLRLENGEESQIIELPQFFFMRVAMGIAQGDGKTREQRTEYALRYYEVYSLGKAMSSTPTLFNSGTHFAQLSSCFGQYYGDDTDQIMDGLKETANYSKFSGGCSLSIAAVRSSGSRIRSTGGKAGGPIPYLKLVNGVMVGFDQSGKRKGSASVYLEPWHPNIFEFLDLREPGDERLRAHDIFPALWIPDLFMQRVVDGGKWSLIDPKVEPRLHETYGTEFEELYTAVEARGDVVATVTAEELWNRILERLFTHGVFWPCFKDTANYRYAQPEVVHNSNLCTEILLRNDRHHSFVCNLASVNLGDDDHLLKRNEETGKFEWNAKLESTVRLMVRNLDTVISIGFIPHANGQRFQEEDRAIGLGCMGWADALAKMGIDYESPAHIEFCNEVWKQISLTAIDESANLAQEKGSYPAFDRSTWADGLLPVDTLRHHHVVKKFGLDLDAVTPFGTLDDIRAKAKKGMRNSCLLAIAPTATISNIVGAQACTELPWDLGYEKKNLSGVFSVFATTIKNNRHNLPLKTARSVDQLWTIWSAAARQIWIDQGQSTNIFLQDGIPLERIGEVIDDLYIEAWKAGLKTTYYFYAKAEETDAINLHQVDTTVPSDVANLGSELGAEWTGGRVCDINGGPDCESCQ